MKLVRLVPTADKRNEPTAQHDHKDWILGGAWKGSGCADKDEDLILQQVRHERASQDQVSGTDVFHCELFGASAKL